MRRFPWLTPRIILRHAPHAVIVVLACTALANLLGSTWSLPERLAHFPVYWSPLALVLGAGFAAMKQWRWSLAALVLAGGYGAQLALLWQPPSGQTPGKTMAAGSVPRTVLSFNVLKSNRQHATVLGALQAQQADVVYLTEMTPAWFDALAPLENDYPHRLGNRNHSDWLLSKHPLESARAVAMTFATAQAANAPGTPSQIGPLANSYEEKWSRDELLVATVVMDGKRVRVGGIHPPTPMNSRNIMQQRACAAIYRQELDADPAADAKLLMGDFNTSHFSPTFRLILKTTGLQDTVRGFGYGPTWGPRMPRDPWLPWLGVPIDHVLASGNVRVLDHEVGPNLGSDHRWVKVRFVVE